MVDVGRFRKIFLCLLVSLLLAPKASAIGIDLLGEVAKPLIGPAQEKVKGALVYIWLQPYAGYGWGTSDQKRIAANGTVSTANGLKADGFLYGARGGLLLYRSIRVGLDYSVHNISRATLIENSTGGFVQSNVKGKNTMTGAIVSFDVPFTPLQGFVTKYFKSIVRGDGAADGDGWGAGVSFVLKNPFILSFETRKLNYTSAIDPGTLRKAEASYSQYYANLLFSLF